MYHSSHATTRIRATRFLSLLVLFSLLSVVFARPLPARAGVSFGVSVNVGPPAIPYYVQPPAPAPNYIWSPGYWAYDGNSGGYYWVPGTWVPAPAVGVYWTPGYWGWNGAAFVFNSGYWGPSVGYYGGVNYGYGYYGNGYAGGRWDHNHFMYNTAITRVGGNFRNYTYSNRSVVNNRWNRTSYNGGRGGINARPSSNQLAAARQRRFGPTSVQAQHQTYAAQTRASYASANHGRPATVAVARPYSAANRPSGARPTAATSRTTHSTTARTAATHAAPRTATAHNAMTHTATARTATAHTATARTATVAHHTAPVAHAAPAAYAAPVAHARTEQRVAPRSMTLQRAVPQQHAYAAPRAAAAPQRMAAPQRAAPARPAAAPAQHAQQGGHPPR